MNKQHKYPLTALYCAIDKGLVNGETDGKGNLEVNLELENSQYYSGVYKMLGLF